MAHSATSPGPGPTDVGHETMRAQSQPSEYSKIWENMADRLEEEMREHPEQGPCYVPLGDIVEIFNTTTTNALFRSWQPHSTDEDRKRAFHLLHQRQPEEDLGAYRHLRVFAALIYLRNTRYIEKATSYLLHPSRADQWRPPTDDSCTETTTQEDFYNSMSDPGDGFYWQFFEKKESFCALVLKTGGNHEMRKDQLVPFFLENNNLLGKGGTGEVYKVKIGKHHWVDKYLSNLDDMPLAVKKFSNKTPRASFDHESQLLAELRSTSIKSENVMLPMASLVHGTHYYLIYELAEMDLDRYMEETTRKTSSGAAYSDQTRWLLKNLTDLVGALKWIHDYEPYRQIWHRDIKPNNILVVGRGSEKVLMLADFDRARDQQSLSSSGALPSNPRDEQPYRAPEVVEGKGGRRGDVWAMACIVVLVLTWLDGGIEGVNAFWDGRATKNGAKGESEQFYTNSSNSRGSNSSDILSTFVKSWLKQLIKSAGDITHTFPAEDLVWYQTYVQSVVSNLSEKVFVNRDDRVYAPKFYEFMHEAYAQIPVRMHRELQLPSPEIQRPSASLHSRSRSRTTVPNTIPKVTPSPANKEHISEDRHLSDEEPEDDDRYGGFSNTSLSPNMTPRPNNTALQLWSNCSDIKDGKSPPDDLGLQDTNLLNDYCRACGDGLIHKAIRNDSEEWFDKLLDTGKIDVNMRNRRGDVGFTPIILSGKLGKHWATQRLLENGCDLPKKKEIKSTISSIPMRDALNQHIKTAKNRRR